MWICHQNASHKTRDCPEDTKSYYHMKVEVPQTRGASPGDRFECYSHSGDIPANICTAQCHLRRDLRGETGRWIRERHIHRSFINARHTFCWFWDFWESQNNRSNIWPFLLLYCSRCNEGHVPSLSRLMADSDDKSEAREKSRAGAALQCN